MISTLDKLLRPIARLCILRGTSFSEVADRLKLQFLRAAEVMGEKPTDSRLSVMTGLQRRDIARLRKLAVADSPKVNHLARLIFIWQNDLSGAPLSRDAFDDLARSIRKDVHPRTLLEQLMDDGSVAQSGDQIKLLAETYQPLPGSDGQLAYLASNGGDFFAAAVDNVANDPPPHYEQAAHFSGLSEAAIAELKASYREEHLKLLQSIAARAAQLQTTAPGKTRFRAGGYFYETDQDDA